MRAEDREPLLDLLEHAFGERELFAGYMDNWPGCDPNDFLLACDGERPVSCVQIFEIDVRLAGETIRLGGIGSVATHGGHRGRGIAGRLMRDAHAEMRERAIPLALLFAGPHPFYEALGWHRVPGRFVSIFSPATPPSGTEVRAFESDDLPVIREIYDAYNADLSGTTVRDAAYWDAQLLYAGTPDELFLVAVEDSRAVAYARRILIDGWPIVMEYARIPGAAAALARVLVETIPATGRVDLPACGDTELRIALESCGAAPAPMQDPRPMWRVLDAKELSRIAGRDDLDELALLEFLVDTERSVYWPSDRF